MDVAKTRKQSRNWKMRSRAPTLTSPATSGFIPPQNARTSPLANMSKKEWTRHRRRFGQVQSCARHSLSYRRRPLGIWRSATIAEANVDSCKLRFIWVSRKRCQMNAPTRETYWSTHLAPRTFMTPLKNRSLAKFLVISVAKSLNFQDCYASMYYKNLHSIDDVYG